MTEDGIGIDQIQHFGIMTETQSSDEKISEILNDEEMLTADAIEFENTDQSEYNYNASHYQIDEMKEEPIDEEIDTNELFGGFQQGEINDWQQLRVEIVREEPEPGEFVKEEPTFYDEYGT